MVDQDAGIAPAERRQPCSTDIHISPMNLRRLTIALVSVVCIAAAAQDQNSPLSAVELINEVVANELTDRVQQRKWTCLIEKREGKQTLTEEQVETKDGPFHRLLAIGGTALDPDQRRQENARMDRLLHDPSQQLKLKQGQDEDEQKLEKLMHLMPQAFLYDYDGVEGNLVRLKFRPNPNYVPTTYEARVAHSLAGTILIDSQQKRLAKFSGQLMNSVELGYGILGRIDNGGTIEIGRAEVGPLQWKTTLINIRLSGRLMLFKTINKQEYETRSDFHAVPGDLSLSEASQLLLAPAIISPVPAVAHRPSQ
jgi:hypothetical protein